MNNVVINENLAKDILAVILAASQRNAFRLEEYASVYLVYQNLNAAIEETKKNGAVITESANSGE